MFVVLPNSQFFCRNSLKYIRAGSYIQYGADAVDKDMLGSILRNSRRTHMELKSPFWARSSKRELMRARLITLGPQYGAYAIPEANFGSHKVDLVWLDRETKEAKVVFQINSGVFRRGDVLRLREAECDKVLVSGVSPDHLHRLTDSIIKLEELWKGIPNLYVVAPLMGLACPIQSSLRNLGGDTLDR